MLRVSLFLALFLAGTAQATFVPEEEIHYDALPFGASNMDEAQFRQIIADITTAYSPAVATNGGKLSINGDWKNEKLNAGATQQFGNWQVVITGGLARRPELTPDGFALITCHELGHHLGGFPFGSGGFNPGGVWAASEGQADYFASQVCAKKLWRNDREKNASFRATVSDYVKERCDAVWGSEDEQNLCYRTMAGVDSTTHTMAVLMKKPIPEFQTPDPAKVDKNFSAHPQPQCRMDTGMQGALCTASWNENFIPGKKAPGGVEGIGAEEEAARASCTKSMGYILGMRPLCWFKPRL